MGYSDSLFMQIKSGKENSSRQDLQILPLLDYNLLALLTMLDPEASLWLLLVTFAIKALASFRGHLHLVEM